MKKDAGRIIKQRPNWDEYFVKLASLVAERSTCLRHNIGAVIVKDKNVIATGYNGAAKGMKDCLELGCLKDKFKIQSGTGHEICRALHAEQNAIIQAAFHGTSVRGAIMYCTHVPPCMICARMIVNAGIKEVIGYQEYRDSHSLDFLKKAGVKVRKIQRPNPIIIFRD
jgi:dCMP deaminase